MLDLTDRPTQDAPAHRPAIDRRRARRPFARLERRRTSTRRCASRRARSSRCDDATATCAAASARSSAVEPLYKAVASSAISRRLSRSALSAAAAAASSNSGARDLRHGADRARHELRRHRGRPRRPDHQPRPLRRAAAASGRHRVRLGSARPSSTRPASKPDFRRTPGGRRTAGSKSFQPTSSANKPPRCNDLARFGKADLVEARHNLLRQRGFTAASTDQSYS